jgi:adenosylcobyric acid synthase
LMADCELDVELIHAYRPLQAFDMILLPGSKMVMSDLRWLKSQGLFNEIKMCKKPIFGLCGGYQMLCHTLHDADALEHNSPGTEVGFEYIDDDVHYQNPKILANASYSLFGYPIKGYEIHYGRMRRYPLYYQSQLVCGTHVHGVFDDDDFRSSYLRSINPTYQGYLYGKYRETEIQQFADKVGENLDIGNLLGALKAES